MNCRRQLARRHSIIRKAKEASNDTWEPSLVGTAELDGGRLESTNRVILAIELVKIIGWS